MYFDFGNRNRFIRVYSTLDIRIKPLVGAWWAPVTQMAISWLGICVGMGWK